MGCFSSKARSSRPPPPSAAAAVEAAPPRSWATLSTELPVDTSPEESIRRYSLFGRFDTRGNGFLTRDECVGGARRTLRLQVLSGNADQVAGMAFDAAALEAAKRLCDGRAEAPPSTIGPCDFRCFLLYLSLYAEIRSAFSTMSGAAEPGPLDPATVRQLAPAIPEAEVDSLPTDHKGQIPLDTFIDWAVRSQIADEPLE